MQPTYLSDVSKVADVLRNFSKYRKKPGKKGGGKTWPGLKNIPIRISILGRYNYTANVYWWGVKLYANIT